MNKPKLSIIIPTWNTGNITLNCVKTIKKYLTTITYELIIVDNGSTDNTSSLFSKIKDLKYIQNNQNLGFSKANNIGARLASGEYLLFMNSDIELIDSSLQLMMKYYESHPDIGLIGPQFLNPNLSIQGSITPPQTPLNAFREYYLGYKSYSKYYLTTPAIVNAISGGFVLISNKLFHKIGGWDERYFFYYEDLELCRQIQKQKKKIMYYPLCKIIHRHGASGTKIASKTNQWRRLVPSAKKYFGLPQYYLIYLIIWSSQKWSQIFLKK